jgi:phospholipid/cholesterol/gamma-HCH transport system substrate-binding protein
MRIDAQYDRIPEDSTASVLNEGLLGGKYISLRPGGLNRYLKSGSVIEQTRSAVVLENLINKFFANYSLKGPAVGGPPMMRRSAFK